MTSVTMKTFPTPKLEAGTAIIATPQIEDPRPIFDMTAYVLSQLPDMGDQGFSGYSYVFRQIPNPLDGGNTTVGGIVFSGVLQNSSPEELRGLWDPIFAHVKATWPDLFMTLYYEPKSYPSFLGWFSENYDTTSAGENSHVGSRLLDRDALTKNLTSLSEAFERFTDGEISTAYLVSGKGVHNAKPRGCSGNAVLPAWRKAYIHATMGISFNPLNVTAARDAEARVKKRVAALTELAPNMGAYMNEVCQQSPTLHLSCPFVQTGPPRKTILKHSPPIGQLPRTKLAKGVLGLKLRATVRTHLPSPPPYSTIIIIFVNSPAWAQGLDQAGGGPR